MSTRTSHHLRRSSQLTNTVFDHPVTQSATIDPGMGCCHRGQAARGHSWHRVHFQYPGPLLLVEQQVDSHQPARSERLGGRNGDFVKLPQRLR